MGRFRLGPATKPGMHGVVSHSSWEVSIDLREERKTRENIYGYHHFSIVCHSNGRYRLAKLWRTVHALDPALQMPRQFMIIVVAKTFLRIMPVMPHLSTHHLKSWVKSNRSNIKRSPAQGQVST
jgi:hypothetical protein